MKRLTLTISTMIIVLVLAIWMLQKEFREIELLTRIIISVGASAFSGLISYFLFRGDK